jgi:peptidyl-prolyl cis-trans isomerase C
VHPTATLNGVALHEAGKRPDPVTLMQRAWDELLRQHAVKQGLLLPCQCQMAVPLTESVRQVIADMLEREVVVMPVTDDGACRHYFESNKHLFLFGEALHVRHILFAVTPGANVHALTARAEDVLLELSRQGVHPDRFSQLAEALSDCPTRTCGGDLGWVGPRDCVAEMANELFEQRHAGWGMGVHPRLVHTGQGFHLIEVLGRRKGRLQSFDEVKARIAHDLTQQARATARRQYLRHMMARAQLEGLDLDGSDSPWVQ